jgi:hypothetical protein
MLKNQISYQRQLQCAICGHMEQLCIRQRKQEALAKQIMISQEQDRSNSAYPKIAPSAAWVKTENMHITATATPNVWVTANT